MNETKSLETQLKSWAPRRPSAKLEARLFGRPVEHPAARLFFAWLAPAAACLLLGVSVLNPRNEGVISGDDGSSRWVGMMLSNQSCTAYFPANYRASANRLDTFEWTNGRASSSSYRPLTPAKSDEQEGIWKK